MKKCLSVLLILILCASVLVGCGEGGGGAGSTGLSGKYIITSMDENGVVTDLAEMESMFEQMGMKLEDAMYLEFKSDGKFDMTIFGETVSGTYTSEGNTATLAVDGESINATINAGEISLEQDGTKMVFKKK